MKCEVCGTNIPERKFECPNCGFQFKNKTIQPPKIKETLKSKIKEPDLSRRYRIPIFTHEENKNRYILISIVIFIIFASASYIFLTGKKLNYFDDGIVTTDFIDQKSSFIKKSFPEVTNQNEFFQQTFKKYYQEDIKVNAKLSIDHGNLHSYALDYTYNDIWTLLYHTYPYEISIKAICRGHDSQLTEQEVLNYEFVNEITLHEFNTEIHQDLFNELLQSKENIIIQEQYETFSLELERNKENIIIRIE